MVGFYKHPNTRDHFIKDFEVSWRQHFLDVMKPQFLPAGWNLYHNHERIEEKFVNLMYMRKIKERENLILFYGIFWYFSGEF